MKKPKKTTKATLVSKTYALKEYTLTFSNNFGAMAMYKNSDNSLAYTDIFILWNNKSHIYSLDVSGTDLIISAETSSPSGAAFDFSEAAYTKANDIWINNQSIVVGMGDLRNGADLKSVSFPLTKKRYLKGTGSRKIEIY